MTASEADRVSEVKGAIDAFMQILEVMPNDLAALEALWRAYSDIGDVGNSLNFLVRLAGEIKEQEDLTSARRVLNSISGVDYFDPRIEMISIDLNTLISDGKGEAVEKEVSRAHFHLNMSEELVLVWALREAGLVDENVYSQVASILGGETPTGHNHGLTAMHILDTHPEINMDSVLEFLSREYSTPLVELSCFDVMGDHIPIFPQSVISSRQAVPFGQFGRDDLQVAILNPGNKALRDNVEEMTGKHCHFYLCRPSEMDKVAEEILDSSDAQ